MNPIKTVLEKAKINQKDAAKILKVKQSLMSYRMNNDIIGSIEMSIEAAKELKVNKYTIVGDGYDVTVRIK